MFSSTGKAAFKQGALVTIASPLFRIVTAIVGGYLFANAAGVLLTILLPVYRGDAVVVAILLSFLLYAAAVMYTFAVHSVRRACFGVWGATALFAMLAWLLTITGFAD